MFRFKRPGPPSWLLVFLGNPGEPYEDTRHNAGFLVCDALAERLNIPVQRLKHRALTGRADLDGASVLLMKPVTFMNLSGEAVADAARFYKLAPERILVVSDDSALPLGKLRLRAGGSSGGHNGLKSIAAHLNTEQYPRLRIGIGAKPHADFDQADWVLGKFSPADRKVIDEAAEKAAEAIECVVKKGVAEAMARYNGI